MKEIQLKDFPINELNNGEKADQENMTPWVDSHTLTSNQGDFQELVDITVELTYT